MGKINVDRYVLEELLESFLVIEAELEDEMMDSRLHVERSVDTLSDLLGQTSPFTDVEEEEETEDV